ncbi:MAG: hypothetical protein DRN04_09205 [Thermoprotei archaeon]|nr:MAG: hypothetical protein DRN04_09205 [Thermoprotei archaeon]
MKYSIYFTPKSLRQIEKLDYYTQQKILYTLSKASLREETRCEEVIAGFRVNYYLDKKRRNLTVFNLQTGI